MEDPNKLDQKLILHNAIDLEVQSGKLACTIQHTGFQRHKADSCDILSTIPVIITPVSNTGTAVSAAPEELLSAFSW